MLTMILAMDRNNLIGDTSSKYGLAWHYPEDMKFYKKNCVGKINVYGRKTIEHIGRVLPNREMICLSRDSNYKFDTIKTINDKNEILKLAENNEIMINGGVEIFNLFIEDVDKIILTRIDAEHDGDVYYNLDLENFELREKEVNGILSFESWYRK